MILADARRVPLAATTPVALVLFERALTQFQRHGGNPLHTIDMALTEDPEFVLGHLFRAGVLGTTEENACGRELRSSLRAARRLETKASDRERGLMRALEHLGAGDRVAASSAFDDVLERYPCDALALQLGYRLDWIAGDVRNLRDRCARVLPHWSVAMPGYAFALGMYAFGLQENNFFDSAEDLARRALVLEPRNAWAVHALAHVFEMQARVDEGIELYLRCRDDWEHDQDLAHHNWWHLALFYLDRGDYQQAFEIYDDYVAPGTSAVVSRLRDASAFLWRTWLLDIDAGARWFAVAERWQEVVANGAGLSVANTIHSMLAFVADARETAVAELLLERQSMSEPDSSDQSVRCETVLALCRALQAFGKKDYDQSIELLVPLLLRTYLWRPVVDRELLNQTLLEAAIRAGRFQLAGNLCNERIEARPHSPLAWRFRLRALEAEKAASEQITDAQAVDRGLLRGRPVVSAELYPSLVS